MHQIMVTILRRLHLLFPKRSSPFRYRKTPHFLWEVLLFVQDLLYESTVFPHQETGGKM